MMYTGLIFNVQRFSLHDGPGIRSTVFMKGCPLACGWCHNPEGQSPRQEFVRMRSRCMNCGRCTGPELASPVVTGRNTDDVDACPTGALQAVGRRIEVATLVTTLLCDRIFFDESGGGVTFSGGEPLMQAAFVTEAMRRLQSEGAHTTLDTCGLARWEDVRDAAAHANLVLYDLKLMDDDRHRAATGASNHVILQNLQALAALHANIRIRLVVIPGVNDDLANLDATAAFLQPLPGLRHVDLLAYHATGAAKSARLGMDHALHGTRPPGSDRLESLAAFLRARGFTATIGGLA